MENLPPPSPSLLEVFSLSSIIRLSPQNFRNPFAPKGRVRFGGLYNLVQKTLPVLFSETEIRIGGIIE